MVKRERGRPRKISPEMAEVLKTAYLEGESSNQLAKRYPYSATIIKDLIREAGLARKDGARSGKHHWNWIEDRSKLHKQERRCDRKECVEWRIKIFKRDGFKCVKCGHINGNGTHEDLNAHHIKSWKDYSELRFDMDNGITLCVQCHWTEHKRIVPLRSADSGRLANRA